MKQQFFVGDIVRICDTPQESTHVDWTDLMGGYTGDIGTVTEVSEYHCSGRLGYVVDDGYYFDAKWLTIVERTWQKNTGVQPVEDDVVVQVKQQRDNTPLLYTGRAKGFIWIRGPVISVDEWRIADSDSSDEEQPKAIPPSHVALGDELTTVDATSTSVSTEQDFVNSPKHYAFFDGVEAIEIIASSMSVEAFRGYCIGNALKYRLRVGKKDKVEQEIAKADKYGELFEKHKHLCKGSNDA